MLGLEKIVDKILEIGEELLPFEVINHYDRGVRLRFGKAVLDKEKKPKILNPGFHWKIPFTDTIHSHMVKTATLDLQRQFVTTKDLKPVMISGVLKYDVNDVATLLLEVDSPKAAVGDMSLGIIKTAVVDKDWVDCNNDALEKEITIKIRREAKKWGIDVKSLTLTDLMIVQPSIMINTQ